jgi:hypothetical protein
VSNRRVAKQRTPDWTPSAATSRSRTWWWVGGLVAVAVVVALVVALSGGGEEPAAPTADDASTVVDRVSAIPASVFDQVGVGDAKNPPTAIGDPPLQSDGKPLVAYVGAEFCPYCAAERWAMTAALSRFGTFERLPLTHSASEDVYPDTQTVSFHGSSYTSDVISFEGVETATNELVGGNYERLDTPRPEIEALVQRHSSGSIPFVDFGGKYVLSGAQVDPGVLAGKSATEIAAALSKPDTDIARQVIGAANVLTAAICAATDDAPTDVCQSSGVQAAAAALGR